MKNIHANILTPLFKTIDKVIFGIENGDDDEDDDEIMEQPKVKEWITHQDQEDRVVIRSIN